MPDQIQEMLIPITSDIDPTVIEAIKKRVAEAIDRATNARKPNSNVGPDPNPRVTDTIGFVGIVLIDSPQAPPDTGG